MDFLILAIDLLSYLVTKKVKTDLPVRMGIFWSGEENHCPECLESAHEDHWYNLGSHPKTMRTCHLEKNIPGRRWGTENCLKERKRGLLLPKWCQRIKLASLPNYRKPKINIQCWDYHLQYPRTQIWEGDSSKGHRRVKKLQIGSKRTEIPYLWCPSPIYAHHQACQKFSPLTFTLKKVKLRWTTNFPTILGPLIEDLSLP